MPTKKKYVSMEVLEALLGPSVAATIATAGAAAITVKRHARPIPRIDFERAKDYLEGKVDSDTAKAFHRTSGVYLQSINPARRAYKAWLTGVMKDVANGGEYVPPAFVPFFKRQIHPNYDNMLATAANARDHKQPSANGKPTRKRAKRK